MRAWQVVELGEPESALRLLETADPVPGPGEVLVRIEAAGVNFPDLLLCRGQYQIRPSLPFTPGLEGAGYVAGQGPGCTLEVGRRVVVMPALPQGSFQQLVVAKEADVFPVPVSVPAVEAAALSVTYVTAHIALHRRAGVKPGEVVLVHGGAGGVGSAAIQIAAAAGARVIATAGGPTKVDFCRRLGAHLVVDHLSDDFVAAVNSETSGRGADIIVDPVGGTWFDRSRKCIASEGRLLVIGFAAGEISQAPVNHVLVKNYSVVGMHLNIYRQRYPAVVRQAHDELVRLHEAGLVKPYVSAQFEFEQLPAALRHMSGRAAMGKTVVRVSAD